MADEVRRDPPAGPVARVFTIACPILPILIPVAWCLQRLALRQASNDSRYAWRRRWWERPLVLTVVVWGAFLAVGMALYAVSELLWQDFA